MANKAERATIEPRMLTTAQCCAYTGRGITSMKEWCREIGAVRKFGTMIRFDRKVIDAALDALEQAEV